MKIVFLFLFILFQIIASAQASIDSIIEVKETRSLLEQLAGEEMQGRGNYSIHLHKAATIIEQEFAKSNLTYFPGFNSYTQYFTTLDVSTVKLIDTISNLLVNVIGVLEGKSKPGEVIIFSAHFDHMGRVGNELFYGANDNASGTVAMLMLMRYYAERSDNERTLVFCAFSGEELGLHGSEHFSKFLKTDSVIAMINLEMLGRTNAAGKNGFILTGDRYSNLYDIIKKNLEGSAIKIRREMSGRNQLFRRSDNYPFARKGVPAHTIMSSDDDDNCYHKPCDVLSRLEIPNMVNIIKSIALASSTLVDGTDTPSRINPKKLYW